MTDDFRGQKFFVTEPVHPYVAAWWPPGHLLGYEHGFTHQVVDLLTAITLATIHNAPVAMGPAYWIPAVAVPALLVTHYVTFILLLRRWDE